MKLPVSSRGGTLLSSIPLPCRAWCGNARPLRFAKPLPGRVSPSDGCVHQGGPHLRRPRQVPHKRSKFWDDALRFAPPLTEASRPPAVSTIHRPRRTCSSFGLPLAAGTGAVGHLAQGLFGGRPNRQRLARGAGLGRAALPKPIKPAHERTEPKRCRPQHKGLGRHPIPCPAVARFGPIRGVLTG